MAARRERVRVHTYRQGSSGACRVGGGKWTKSLAEITVDADAFSEGSLRTAHKAMLFIGSGGVGGGDGDGVAYVCKFAKDAANTPNRLYFADVEAQVVAAAWAQRFNDEAPPPPPSYVAFVAAAVVEFVDRPGRPVCGGEGLIVGEIGCK
jgi:hypothetical protein